MMQASTLGVWLGCLWSTSRHHPGALLHHLARRMRLRTEAVLAPLSLRPRHLVALTVLRDRGGSTQAGACRHPGDGTMFRLC